MYLLPFRNIFNSLDVYAGVNGSYKAFSATAASTYSEINSLITSNEESSFSEKGIKRSFHKDFLQISREVTTSITISGKTARVKEVRYVDSRPTIKPLNSGELMERSRQYLLNKFLGERNKIHGTTYTDVACKFIDKKERK